MRAYHAFSAVFVTILVTGCAANAGSADEHTDSSEQALTQTAKFTFDEARVQALLHVIDAAGVRVSGNNAGVITFTPSPTMAGLIAPGDPDPAHHSLSVVVPSTPQSLPFPCGDSTASLTGFAIDPLSIGVDLVGDHVTFHANFGGSVHMHTGWGCPDFDVIIKNASVSVDLARTPGTAWVRDSLIVQGAAVHVIDFTAECGIAGWCSKPVEWLAPNVDGKLSEKLQSMLGTALADPNIPSAIDAALAKLMAVDLTVDHSGTPWRTVAGSLFFFGSQATWRGTHDTAPGTPQGCSLTQDCSGSVVASCVSTGDAEQLQRWDGSRWINMFGSDDIYANNPMIDVHPSYVVAGTYRVCFSNAGGVACSGAMTSLPTASSCYPGGGGGGGGGSGGGGGHTGGCGIHCM